jgi:hypothetical protein
MDLIKVRLQTATATVGVDAMGTLGVARSIIVKDGVRSDQHHYVLLRALTPCVIWAGPVRGGGSGGVDSTCAGLEWH